MRKTHAPVCEGAPHDRFPYNLGALLVARIPANLLIIECVHRRSFALEDLEKIPDRVQEHPSQTLFLVSAASLLQKLSKLSGVEVPGSNTGVNKMNERRHFCGPRL
jgi:hypothetical protein